MPPVGVLVEGEDERAGGVRWVQILAAQVVLQEFLGRLERRVAPHVASSDADVTEVVVLGAPGLAEGVVAGWVAGGVQIVGSVLGVQLVEVGVLQLEVPAVVVGALARLGVVLLLE